MEDQHLISVDELRAAGALDVPAAWRKSLQVERVERHLFSGMFDDEDTRPEERETTPRDPDDTGSADELP